MLRQLWIFFCARNPHRHGRNGLTRRQTRVNLHRSLIYCTIAKA